MAIRQSARPPAYSIVHFPPASPYPVSAKDAAKAAHTDRRLPVEVKIDSYVSGSRH